MKLALISGISGQDGSYLAKYLLDLGYRVIGGTKVKDIIPDGIKKLGISNKIEIIDLDFTNENNIFSVIEKYKPDEFYNLAAQSSVGKSFLSPLETSRINAFGVAYLLEAIRLKSKNTKLFQASSSEIFGNEILISENSHCIPNNPYSTSKTFGHLLTQNYRDIFGLYLVSGILYNHDSELRGENFFTKSVSRHVANYFLGKKEVLRVGNIYVKRDIGYAPEYVKAMHITLQGEKAEDFIISTGKSELIKNFINYCFNAISIHLEWKGEGINEKGFRSQSGELLVEISPEKFRPTDTPIQESNPSKIFNVHGWKATKSLSDIAKIMVEYDISELKKTTPNHP
ncbi:MAG: GDP-mannose 4,6-dehydratase [Spirochaetia bacterium]|nr:GDP-mannose 4,6-dehydratase [Spirochaetia bacterium]